MLKWVTLEEKMGNTWKNLSHLRKWVTLGKMSGTSKKWYTPCKKCQLEKWVTLGKIGRNRKKWTQLEKSVIPEEIGHTWKDGTHFEKYDTWKNGPQL